jgi:nitroreductase
VVRERARLAALAALSPYGKFIAHSAATIVIAQTQKHEFDAGRCAQNMMVAAWGDGVGSCPAHLPEAEVGRLLGIPAPLLVNRVIAFGYVDPARAAAPASVRRTRMPLTELVHWETW